MSERLPRTPPPPKRRDDTPSLFGDAPPDPAASAYPRAAPPPGPAAKDRLRPIVAELAAEVLSAADRRLRDAMRLAIAELMAGRPETARTILERAVEDERGRGE